MIWPPGVLEKGPNVLTNVISADPGVWRRPGPPDHQSVGNERNRVFDLALFLRLSLEPFPAPGAAEPGGGGLRLPGVPAARAGNGRHRISCAGGITCTITLAAGYFRRVAK